MQISDEHARLTLTDVADVFWLLEAIQAATPPPPPVAQAVPTSIPQTTTTLPTSQVRTGAQAHRPPAKPARQPSQLSITDPVPAVPVSLPRTRLPGQTKLTRALRGLRRVQ